MQRDRLPAQALGQTERLCDSVLSVVGEGVVPGGMHVHRNPRHSRTLRHATRRADQLARNRGLVDTDEEPILGRPRPGNGVCAHVCRHLGVDALGGDAHGELAQGREIALAEEMLNGAGDLIADVDLAFAQALDQVLGWQVDQLDLIGELQHLVREGLADADAGDALHDVVQALEVLDVERGEDIDPCGQQFLDVLMALHMSAALDVGMGELVDNGELRLAPEQRVEVHLGEDAAAIAKLAARQDVEAAQQRLGLRPAVGLDDADDHVRAFLAPLTRGLEHGVGLADAGVGAEENLEPAAPLLLRLLQQRFGCRPPLFFSHPRPACLR